MEASVLELDAAQDSVGVLTDLARVLADLNREIDEGRDDRDRADELSDVPEIFERHRDIAPAA